MADKDEKSSDKSSETRGERRSDRSAQAGAAVATARLRVAQVVWLACVLAALVLAGAALLIALKANGTNGLVKFVRHTADSIDLGVFSRKSGVFHFKGHSHSADTKNALVNYGLAAVVWLVVGRIVERIVRP